MLSGRGAPVPDLLQRWANLRAFAGGCGLADDVLVEPDTNDGFLTPLPGNYGPLGPLGGADPVGFTPNGVPEKIVAEAIRMNTADAGHRLRLGSRRRSCKAPGVNGSTVPLPYGLDPARVPLAGTYVEGAQQQSRLTSAWYELPPPDDAHPLVVVTAAGTITGDSVSTGAPRARRSNSSTRRPARRAPVPAGRLVALRHRSDPVVAQPAVRPRPDSRRRGRGTCRRRGLSLTPGDWVAVTPPRVPELRSVQEYVGSTSRC